MREVIEIQKNISLVLLIIGTCLIIFSVFHSIKTNKIVNVLNNYDKVNRIIIVKNGKEKTITDNKLEQYKEAFEPKDILDGYKKEIKQVLGENVIDVSYYIDDKKLLESSIYELTGDFEHGSFNVDGSHYIMKVDSDFRSVKKTDRNFLKDLFRY